MALFVVFAAAACGEDTSVIFQNPSAGGGGDGGTGGGSAGGGNLGGGGHGGGLGGHDARLIVAADDGSGHGVFIWNEPGAIDADVAPDVVVAAPETGQAVAVAANGPATYVATAQPGAALVALGETGAIEAATAPLAVIPLSSFPGGTIAPERVVFGGGDSGVVIASSFLDGAYLFHGVPNLDGAPSAHFTHPFQQLPSVALDPATGRLIAGQISGAGLLAWNDAVGASGEPAHDHEIYPDAIWDLALNGPRTYGAAAPGGGGGPGHGGGGGVLIWQTGDFTSAAAPIVVLGEAEGVDSFIEDIAVSDGLLAVSLQAGGPGSGARVLLWDDPGAINSPRPPDAVIVLGQTASRLAIGVDDILFALTADGIAIYDTQSMEPTHKATLTGAGTLSGFEDLAVTIHYFK